MIPYIPQPYLELFSRKFYAFPMLVATGLIVGSFYAHRLAKQFGILDDIRRAISWSVVLGFFCAFAFSTIFYFPERIAEHGIKAIFDFYSMSSYGGFIGGFLGSWLYFRKRGIRWARHADILLQSLVIGWIFGRLGCTFAHDHMGQLTSFFMGFQYPGGARHNLGFYEFLYTLIILAPFTLLWNNHKNPPGLYTAYLIFLYGPIRFVLDFMRAEDLLYFGLTFAQYASIGITIIGFIFIQKIKKANN